MTRISFTKWIIISLKETLTKIVLTPKHINQYLSESDNWFFPLVLTIVFGAFFMPVICIAFYPFGFISIPIWIVCVFYSWYRLSDPQGDDV